ncbi:MAG: Gfo/Idh/MocA family oxidoreductase [Phycisphaeraceae bacterium]
MSQTDYELNGGAGGEATTAPALAWRPPRPKAYRPRIGLVGCGGITKHHLAAYRGAGYDVVAMTDLQRDRADARRSEYFPDAEVLDSAAALFARDDIDVVDLAPHPAHRAPLLEQAIDAGKHVLSQKPFVTDLDFGERLVARAEQRGLKLAVNQNGRWAPHVSYMRQAIAAGLVGEVTSVDTAVHWNHNWVKGTPFDNIPHLVLYDFAVHWFDMLHCYTGGRPARRLHADVGPAAGQTARPPLLAQVQVSFEQAQASMQFRAAACHGASDRTVIVGTKGMLVSTGPNLNEQQVTLCTEAGTAVAELDGQWFDTGFDGTMSELACAIEEDREPANAGRDNLASLALCFAAMGSAERGQPVEVGSVRRIEPGWLDDAEA